MFTKLKKKIAEEAAVTPRSGGGVRIPRTVSRESITSAGADSGDDFASDGSSSREDLSSQISRKNEQIRRLEAKLMDYAEQVRNLQKMKDKLEVALEKHQDSSMRKLQEQNEMYQASRAKMAEELALALERKDQEWMVKLADLEEEKKKLSDQVISMTKQNMSLFKKREDLDELEGFQQQELAKIKHMLLQKEESLSKMEEELEFKRKDLKVSRVELQESNHLVSKLGADVQRLQEENNLLAQKRLELVKAQEEAGKKITELEDRQTELQDYIQQISLDLQKAQSTASSWEKKLNAVKTEYKDLKLQHNQLTSATDEKDAMVIRLQEKVVTLEKMLEGTYSGEEGLQELLKEKDALELKLNQMRLRLQEGEDLHTNTVSQLENRASILGSKLEEREHLLCQKDEELNNFKEETELQLKEMKETVQTTNKRLQKREDELKENEEQIKSLKLELELECSRLTQQLNSVKQQCAEKVERLEAQVSALEGAREFDRTAAQHQISELMQDKGIVKERNAELEMVLRQLEAEKEKIKEEMSSRETLSVEIAKALEETRKQKEELQQQVTNLSTLINENEKELVKKTEDLGRKEEMAASLQRDYDATLLQVQHLQSELESCKTRATLMEESAENQIRTMRLQLQEHEQETNGELPMGDIANVQKENHEMEQLIADKNKTIKQLQQRVAELKKTLQKELKIKPDPEMNEEKSIPEPAAPSLTVTNNSDLNDSREINFEYLKHVVLKFMSASETEAFHLIKAVSVLLNFSVEEENLLKETLEYKMSWFGSKPAPKGSIRPSIAKPRTPWS
ncbi:hypothetical protein GDO86_014962 [Hymenochirus boettgeri]|uniref:Golgin subfamily A member 1 n=1 Tax=Hymenochirus boettgeri TaxID=247094 RepID=A0A8T2JW89_9PIPI|nr:hypothetical protein GDO86_014962 [Hymenochirus boettgeri]